MLLKQGKYNIRNIAAGDGRVFADDMEVDVEGSGGGSE